MLPVAQCICIFKAEAIKYLMNSADDFKGMLSNWIQYQPNFKDAFSRDLSKKALT